MDISNLTPGMIGFAKIRGFVGFLIRLGQWFLKDDSRWTHVFIYLGEGPYGKYTIFAAQPGGARYDDLREISEVAWLSMLRPTPEQFDVIKRECDRLKGVSYSFLDYLSLGLLRFGIKWEWVRNRVRDSGHMICSQLADFVYNMAGIHLFQDREHMDVSPGDLANLAVERIWLAPADLTPPS